MKLIETMIFHEIRKIVKFFFESFDHVILQPCPINMHPKTCENDGLRLLSKLNANVKSLQFSTKIFLTNL